MSGEAVVVSGATGFLGSHLCRRLAGDGVPVVALKRSTSSLRRLEDFIDALTLVDVDRTSLDGAVCAAGRPGAVVHAATCYGRRGESPNEILDANHVFPLALLAAAATAGADTFVNSDTVLPPDAGPYAASKRRFLNEARPLAETRKVRLVDLRVQHVYGPGDDDDKFVTRVIRACAREEGVLPLTAGRQRRDFIFVDDAVDAYALVVARRHDLARYVEFDVGSGKPIAVRELVQLVYRLTGSQIELRFGDLPDRVHETTLAHADVEPLRALGWIPRTSHADGLAKTIEHERVAA